MICLGVVTASRAHAEDEATREAKRRYDRASKLFDLGRFADALPEFEAAYEAKPLPDFLFNIGQCQRNMGDYDAAIATFNKLLEAQPDDPRADGIRKLIDELETKRARKKSKELGVGDPGPTPTPPPEDKPIYKKWWFWTGVGVVVAGAGVGTYLLLRPPGTDLGNISFEK
ncbi:MAG: tetratricopeptide repeat protein [Kofleriaceae bacterium]